MSRARVEGGAYWCLMIFCAKVIIIFGTNMREPSDKRPRNYYSKCHVYTYMRVQK
jgi:hypothetical protein